MKKLLLIFASLLYFFPPTNALATDFGSVTDPQTKFTDIGSVITALIPIVIVLAGMVALLFLIVGGFRYMTAQGDPKALDSARGTITSAVVGLVIVLAIGVIVALISGVLGFNILTG